MITKPNTVLVANTVSLTGVTPAVGALVVIDAEKGSPIDVSTGIAASVNRVQLGVVKEAAVTTGHVSQQHPAYIAKTKSFSRDELSKIASAAASDATEDTYTINFTGVKTAATAGDILHVRLDFDLTGGFRKAEEYVFDLASLANDNEIATAVAARFSSNLESWVTATASTSTVTLTAKKAIDYQSSAKALVAPIKYNQIRFDVASYVFRGVDSNLIKAGVVTKTVNSFPGVGNPYVVRDEEKDAFGYLGARFSNVYPNIQPASSVASVGGLVDGTAKYDVLSLVADLKYRSPDQSYQKSTGVSAQIYAKNPNKTNLDAIAEALNVWSGKVEPVVEGP